MNPNELLEEAISDLALKKKTTRGREAKMWEVAQISFRAVVDAASGGNVICKVVLREIIKLTNK